MKPDPLGPMHASLQEGIAACLSCHRICLDTLSNYCLEQGGQHATAHHVRTMLDCANICQTAADFMLRGSPQHGLVCRVCAEVCRVCIEDCEAFVNDERMASCAKACRNCRDSCMQMAE